MAIQLLPSDVIAQIKSSATVTSLNGVVCELVKNSLDAESKKLEITIDYERGNCVVTDDGVGILPSEFEEGGGLGKLYHTSKLPPRASLHGGRGTFLASLSAMSLLVITSRHHQHHSHNSLYMHKSEIVSRQVPAPAIHHLPSGGSGTRITVRDLFGSMPVRVKQRAAISENLHWWGREWEELRRDVISLTLAWPISVSVILKGTAVDQKLVIRAPSDSGWDKDTECIGSRVCKVLYQAALISSDAWCSWISVGASTSQIEIKGLISLEPCATKHLQFLSLGVHPLCGVGSRSIFHDDINRLFADSGFGNEEEGEGRPSKKSASKDHSYTMKELKGMTKRIERWPMFYLNIQLASEHHLEADGILVGNGGLLQEITQLLRAMIEEFLTKNHFRSKSRRASGLQSTASMARPDKEAYLDRSSGIKQDACEFQKPMSPRFSESLLTTSGTEKYSQHPRSSSSDSLSILGARNQPPCGAPLRPKNLFDGWSRIKSGASRAKAIEERSTSLNPVQPQSQNPNTESPRSAYDTAKPSRVPLLPASGIIPRRPFDDVDKEMDQTSQAQAQQQSASITLRGDEVDGVIPWVNPINKCRSSFNKRTGHAITDTCLLDFGRIPAKSRTRLTSRKKSSAPPATIDQPSSGPWISEILNRWENPVFRPSERTIPNFGGASLEEGLRYIIHDHTYDCSSAAIDDAFLSSSGAIIGSISKEALRDAEIISQVDKKFILIKLTTSEVERIGGGSLIIVDQHAADERVRVEQLMCDFFQPPPGDAITSSGIVTTMLEIPILFDLPAAECALLLRQKRYFARWGILYDVAESSWPRGNQENSTAHVSHKVSVSSLPPGIMERCKLDPQLVIKLLRTEILRMHKYKATQDSIAEHQGNEHGWLTRMHDCPKMILDMLNSRACRSSIMFNDEMNREQCATLIHKLSACVFPFQCAHGRPSLVPLAALEKMSHHWLSTQGKESNFGAGFKEWRNKFK